MRNRAYCHENGRGEKCPRLTRFVRSQLPLPARGLWVLCFGPPSKRGTDCKGTLSGSELVRSEAEQILESRG